jgi:DNA-binding PadR family transcriptional regulator
LPGISRALLASRLHQLRRAGVVEKQLDGPGRQTTSYRLTQAGRELYGVIGALRAWGEAWAFGDPAPEELDPVLLMWWMRRRAEVDRLPQRRIVAQFDFHGFDHHGTNDRAARRDGRAHPLPVRAGARGPWGGRVVLVAPPAVE